MKTLFTSLMLCSCLLFSFNTGAAVQETQLFNSFVNNMVKKYQFDEAELKTLFQSVEIKENIIKAMTRPAEGMPWHKYRKIFMTDKRINGGLKFWQDNEATLTAVEEKYGVPAEIIIAIIGVETQYGGNTGHHRVIDALSTLAFDYPKRSKFFLGELKNFLILCREEKMMPLDPTGSYAGAMGIPQFMPSSYRAYAADFEDDKKRDIWNNPADAIASVANYFVEHHWHKGEAITYPVSAEGDAFQKMITKGLKPETKWSQLQALSVNSIEILDKNEFVKLLEYEQEKGDDLWVGLHNFYVITRYNHSPLYAMAVYQLSEAISKKRQLAVEQNKQVVVDNMEIVDNKKVADSKEIIDSKEITDNKEVLDNKEVTDSKELADSKKITDSKEVVESKEIADSKEIVDSKESILTNE
jgi:membrane-bound lytic murein transglycosylase B